METFVTVTVTDGTQTVHRGRIVEGDPSDIHQYAQGLVDNGTIVAFSIMALPSHRMESQ